jgi:hypothetical protein
MMASPDGHKCPAVGCALNVPARKLMCPRHWYMVPRTLRDAVWDAYRDAGTGSPAHRAACVDAIGAVNAKLAAADA